MREQPEPLEVGELGANGRRGHRQRGAFDERLRADRQPRRDVLLDHPEEKLPLALSELRDRHDLHGRARSPHTSSAAVTASPRKRPRSVRTSSPPPHSARAPAARRAGGRRGRARARSGEWQRLVEPERKHHPLGRARRRRQLLGLARRAPAGGERTQVAGERGSVAPAAAPDRADRAHTEAEVVVAEPVAEVVAGAKVTPVSDAAEVRGLVPAVARLGQPRDDELEIRLHRLGLALELRAVGVREARAGLRLQLVRATGARARARGPRARSRSSSAAVWPGIP